MTHNADFPRPHPLELSFGQIEANAEEIARAHEFDSRRQLVKAFAASIGARFEVVAPDDYKELNGGSLIVYGPRDLLIRLSPITGFLRDNFTIAHELGHYFLHSGSPPGTVPIRVGRWGADLLEQQANRFAASFLMPRRLFAEAWSRLRCNAGLVAALFNVSPKAAEIRARSLKL